MELSAENLVEIFKKMPVEEFWKMLEEFREVASPETQQKLDALMEQFNH